MKPGPRGPEEAGRRAHWRYNVRLTALTLLVWFVVTYVAIFFSPWLDTVVILGFPLGYYLGAQGSLVVFVWLTFNYAGRMNRADVVHGVQEQE